MANKYYTLANPYPSKVVAIVQEKSQIVDSTGRPVPLSEVLRPLLHFSVYLMIAKDKLMAIVLWDDGKCSSADASGNLYGFICGL